MNHEAFPVICHDVGCVTAQALMIVPGHLQWWWGYYTWLGRFVAAITVTMALLALTRLRRPARRKGPRWGTTRSSLLTPHRHR